MLQCDSVTRRVRRASDVRTVKLHDQIYCHALLLEGDLQEQQQQVMIFDRYV
mgnify:CR=1 FL=1